MNGILGALSYVETCHHLLTGVVCGVAVDYVLDPCALLHAFNVQEYS